MLGKLQNSLVMYKESSYWKVSQDIGPWSIAVSIALS